MVQSRWLLHVREQAGMLARTGKRRYCVSCAAPPPWLALLLGLLLVGGVARWPSVDCAGGLSAQPCFSL